ncbi:hypothetical protein BH10PSE12_BH10PSE12_17180 [soil metagenome]
MQYKPAGSAGIFEIEVDGRIDADSYRRLVRDLDADIAARGKLAVLEIVRSLGWISPEIWLEDLFWSSRHLASFSRVALVTDTLWLTGMAKGASLAMPVDLRAFPLSEIDAARAWLAA